MLTRLGERDAPGHAGKEGLKETGKAPGHMGKCSRQQQGRLAPVDPCTWPKPSSSPATLPARYGGDSME